MAKDPAVLFYTSDFLTGTMTMTNEQVGKYIRLLCLQHQKRRLSEKDMLHICGTYDEDIYSKFIRDDAGYYNERMDAEAEKRRNYSLSRSNNRNKRQKGANISKSYVHHMENENENEDSKIRDIQEGLEKERARAKKKAFTPPTLDEVTAFAEVELIGSKNAPQDFHDYYASNGWKVGGRAAMKDWRAAFRRWTRNEKTMQHDTNSKGPYRGLSARTRADWDALQEWGRDVEQGRVQFP